MSRPPAHSAHSAPRPYALLTIVLAVLLLLSGVVFWAVNNASNDTAAPAPSPTTPAPNITTPSPTPSPTPEPKDIRFTLAAAGDVLIHQPVHQSARQSDGSYNFSPMLSSLDPWISGADLALCHLEVPLATPGSKLSGYPMFNADPAIATALRDQGWDGCSLASNHSVDKGWTGLVHTLDVLDSLGMGHSGTARSAEEADSPQLYVLEREDREVTIAHLSITYGLNGLSMPSGHPYAVELLDAERTIELATKARAEGADIVLVSMHAGNEYVLSPNADQRRISDALAASGVVDLLIGHHAHIPQTFEKLPGGVHGDGMWVAYGLGNMISNQSSACCISQTSNGLLMIAEFVVTPEGEARVAGVEWVGTTVSRSDKHKLHILAEIPDGAGSLSASEVAKRHSQVQDAVAGAVPERTTPPTAGGPPPKVIPRVTTSTTE